MTASLVAAPVRATSQVERRPGTYRWHFGDLLTGSIAHTVQVLSPSWSTVMDDAGDLSCVLPLADPDTAALKPYVTAAPCKSFLAVSYVDGQGTERFLQGGPIWTHDYDDASRQLTLGAAGMWSYFDHRKLLPILAAGLSPADVTVNISGLSLGTIASRLVALAQSHTGGNVPIVLPDDELGDELGDSDRSYPGYELNVIGEVLRGLTQIDGGPEIQFVPRRSATSPRRLEWVMRVGTVAQPMLTQSGADWVWDATVVESSVSGINVARDGSQMGERAWSRGAGDAETTLFGHVDDPTLLDAGYPLLEVDESRDDGVEQATVDSYAAALATRSRTPTESWNATVRRDENPSVGSYSVGDWAMVRVGTDHPYIPAGNYRSRITQISGDSGPTAKVQFQPTVGGDLVLSEDS